jgi:hypothetical protein
MADQVRLEIAFDGGQIMGALVSSASADALDKALAGGQEASLTLEAADGRYTVALQRVVYVKRFARESHVGFGSS